MYVGGDIVNPIASGNLIFGSSSLSPGSPQIILGRGSSGDTNSISANQGTQYGGINTSLRILANGSGAIDLATYNVGWGPTGYGIALRVNPNRDVQLFGTSTATSTTTGALQVINGGVGIGGNAMVGGAISAGTAAAGVPGEIRASNEITAYYSDRRLKENVQIIDNAVVRVLSLTGITYTPNALAESYGYDRTKKLAGLFADEVKTVLPEAVRPAPFDDDGAGGSKSGENYQTVQYEKLIPLLVEAIKEQQQQINQLRETVAALSNKG